MTECIFCNIVAGKIPNYTVYEDSHSLAFLDVFPHAKGHTVVIPKIHAESFFDINEELVKDFFLAVRKAMDRIDHVLHPDGYNVGWNDQPTAGQAVPHLHVHIFPRWEDDGGKSMHAIVNNPGDISVPDVAKIFS